MFRVCQSYLAVESHWPGVAWGLNNVTRPTYILFLNTIAGCRRILKQSITKFIASKSLISLKLFRPFSSRSPSTLRVESRIDKIVEPVIIISAYRNCGKEEIRTRIAFLRRWNNSRNQYNFFFPKILSKFFIAEPSHHIFPSRPTRPHSRSHALRALRLALQ